MGQRVQTSCADGLTEHFSIIIKLSVIMGVPWILDVLSAGLSYQFGAKTFTLRVVLDILNLMTGILIFLSLICKPSVWKQIKESYCTPAFSACLTALALSLGERRVPRGPKTASNKNAMTFDCTNCLPPYNFLR